MQLFLYNNPQHAIIIIIIIIIVIYIENQIQPIMYKSIVWISECCSTSKCSLHNLLNIKLYCLSII